jgi:NADPH-dependent curcumin reductase CurA
VRHDRRLRRRAAAAGHPALILVNRLKIEGFIVSEHMEVWPEALAELGTLVGTGKLRPRESVAQGIESPRPRPSWACSRARTFGKQLVKSWPGSR